MALSVSADLVAVRENLWSVDLTAVIDGPGSFFEAATPMALPANGVGSWLQELAGSWTARCDPGGGLFLNIDLYVSNLQSARFVHLLASGDSFTHEIHRELKQAVLTDVIFWAVSAVQDGATSSTAQFRGFLSLIPRMGG